MTSEHSGDNTDVEDLENHMRVVPHRTGQSELPSVAAPQDAADTPVSEGIVPQPEPQQPGVAEDNRESLDEQVDGSLLPNEPPVGD